MVPAMRICRYVADGGTARVGYLDGELIVPVAAGDGPASDLAAVATILNAESTNRSRVAD